MAARCPENAPRTGKVRLSGRRWRCKGVALSIKKGRETFPRQRASKIKRRDKDIQLRFCGHKKDVIGIRQGLKEERSDVAGDMPTRQHFVMLFNRLKVLVDRINRQGVEGALCCRDDQWAGCGIVSFWGKRHTGDSATLSDCFEST